MTLASGFGLIDSDSLGRPSGYDVRLKEKTSLVKVKVKVKSLCFN